MCERERVARVVSEGENVTTTSLRVCFSLGWNHISRRGRQRVEEICRGIVEHVL